MCLGRSAVRIQDSHVCRKSKTSVHMNLILDDREMLLSGHIHFSFVSTGADCSILARMFGLAPSSEMVAPRYQLIH